MNSLATIPNPFHSSIVSDPWKSLEAHVPTIHEWAFMRCCEAIARVRATHQTAGMLVHGGAGSGKTHLLARLRSHLAQEAAADGPGGLEESVFVSVQLQTSARMIWRHLRRCLASDLLRREEGAISQFERLLLHRLIRADLVPDDGVAWLEQVRREKCGDHRLEQAVGDLFGRIDAQGQIGYKLRRVIVSLLMRHHLSEASAWLRGESLPKPALQKLGIDVSLNDDEESGEAEDQDDQDRQVVFGLCSLATAELPLVFCFDQVEALQAHPGDTSGLFAFGQLVSNLHAATRHLLLVSCIQSAFLDRLKSGVQQADFARIKEFGEVALNPLTYAEVKQLIRTRLDTLPELKPLRARESNPFWPLPESEILAAYVHADRTPRRLLTRCDELYEVCRQRRDVAPPPPTDQFLDQELERRRQQALEDSEPLQTQSIIEHGLPALVYLAGNGWRQRGPEGPSEVDLWFEGPSGRMAVSICNLLHAPTLVKKLERLKAQLGTPPLGNLTLLRDIRLPVGPKAI
ncbi:MAG TPA: hypothetical protein VJ302_25005, partial [Blastocatellia bacterium]|nr:hypothetical protein [Blastocatellia bacterium]